VRAKK